MKWFAILSCLRQGGKCLKINYYQDHTIEENRVELYFKEMDAEISGVMNYLESYGAILGKKDDVIKRIFLGEILYLEVVERRCYAYLENEVYQVEYNLKSFQEQFLSNGFVQIGKSVLVNIYKVNYMKTDFNMKMQLIMDNGEMLVLNRAYKAKFISFLKNVKEEKDENNR